MFLDNRERLAVPYSQCGEAALGSAVAVAVARPDANVADAL
jgi:hypothetical protein